MCWHTIFQLTWDQITFKHIKNVQFFHPIASSSQKVVAIPYIICLEYFHPSNEIIKVSFIKKNCSNKARIPQNRVYDIVEQICTL